MCDVQDVRRLNDAELRLERRALKNCVFGLQYMCAPHEYTPEERELLDRFDVLSKEIIRRRIESN